MSTSKHDLGVLNLEQRLKAKGFVTDTFVEYAHNGFAGEFDLLTRHETYDVYYEYKSHDNKGARNRAKWQFEKARLAYPDRNFKFVYVTPTCMRRYL